MKNADFVKMLHFKDLHWTNWTANTVYHKMMTISHLHMNKLQTEPLSYPSWLALESWKHPRYCMTCIFIRKAIYWAHSVCTAAFFIACWYRTPSHREQQLSTGPLKSRINSSSYCLKTFFQDIIDIVCPFITTWFPRQQSQCHSS